MGGAVGVARTRRGVIELARPASITFAAPSIGSSDVANALTDVKAPIAAFIAANPNTESMVMLTSPAMAVALAIASNSQTLGATGGSLFGVPVVTGFTGSRIILLDPSALCVADDSGVDITVARHATVEFEAAPTSPPTAGTVMVNLWTSGLAGLKAERWINYKTARANADLLKRELDMKLADLKLLTKAIAPVLKELVAKMLGERDQKQDAINADVQRRLPEREFDRVHRQGVRGRRHSPLTPRCSSIGCWPICAARSRPIACSPRARPRRDRRRDRLPRDSPSGAPCG